MQVKTERQHYVDWLRAGAMFLLVFYHSGRLFDSPAWHIKNAVQSGAINVFNRILDVWQMPLFFMAAGVAVWFSLGSRVGGAFAKERLLRLFVPLVFGILIIVPPQVYLQRITDGDFTGSFWAWYPHTFQGTYSLDNPASGNLSWHHLWFLAYLFVFSLLLLPLFLYFRREKSEKVISRVAGFFSIPGMIFLPVVPLVIINLLLRPIFGWGNQNLISDWANFLYYIFIFFCGFLMVSNVRFIQAIKRQTYIALVVGVVFLVIYGLAQAGTISLPGAGFDSLIGLGCWVWLLTFVGLGVRFLNFTNPLLRYANEAVLPVYILHQTLIVVIGYYVIKWNIPVEGKYFFVIAAVFLSALAIYEAVRRVNVTRFLFGIKYRKPAVAGQ